MMCYLEFLRLRGQKLRIIALGLSLEATLYIKYSLHIRRMCRIKIVKKLLIGITFNKMYSILSRLSKRFRQQPNSNHDSGLF